MQQSWWPSNDALAAADIALSDVIEPEAQAIYDHVDGILSADCRANVVTVPILTRDPAGFYAAPSNGLILSLQDFLTARKEVTQTVRVASGAAFLVPAVITVRVGVSPQFSEAAVATAVGTAIDGVLRGRAFGSNLYVSALKAAIASVAGVVFSNAVIDGSLINNVLSTSKLDVSGNLVVQSSEVVTKGTVTVNTELAE